MKNIIKNIIKKIKKSLLYKNVKLKEENKILQKRIKNMPSKSKYVDRINELQQELRIERIKNEERYNNEEK